MSTTPFVHRLRITYRDCTIGNHVYYSRYLELLEEARGEWFRSIGWPLRQLQEQDIAFPVLTAHLDYLAAVCYDDIVQVQLWVESLTRLRLQVGFAICHEDGKPLVKGYTQHICASVEEKPKRMPAELLQALQQFEAGPVT